MTEHIKNDLHWLVMVVKLPIKSKIKCNSKRKHRERTERAIVACGRGTGESSMKIFTALSGSARLRIWRRRRRRRGRRCLHAPLPACFTGNQDCGCVPSNPTKLAENSPKTTVSAVLSRVVNWYRVCNRDTLYEVRLNWPNAEESETKLYIHT